MNRMLTILGGLGAGAALVYFMDPKKGAGRRAMVQNKVNDLSSNLQHALDSGSRQFGNRAKGLLQDAKTKFSNSGDSGMVPSEHEGMGI